MSHRTNRSSPVSSSRRPSRRDVLRGAGVALTLPFLDAMIPAARGAETAGGAQAAAKSSPRRMVAIQTNMGVLPQHFFPTKTGLDYESKPYLDLLKAFKNRFTLFSGVSHPDVDGAHEAERSFLSATPHPGSAAFKSTISLDQLMAEKLGPTTRFPSFTLDVNGEGSQGMVFSRSGVKTPGEKSPAALYRRMFVEGAPAEVDARVEDLRRGRSLLDFVGGDAGRLKRAVGPADRDRLDQYFTAVRDLERQLELAQEWERRPKPKTSAPELVDVQDRRKLIDGIRLMLEVVRLGFESDSTRVATLFINTFS
ncbi:MAG: DUF1552 domain-containing protein, partial [Planctomycetia bacterium]